MLITDDIGGTFVNADNDGKYIDTFDGKDDSFFSQVLSFIHKELSRIDFANADYFFKIQMYYMLLWSGIDMYYTSSMMYPIVRVII